MSETPANPSTPSVASLKALSLPRQLYIGAALVLLIDSFLPWYHFSFGSGKYKVSDSASGWHQIGVFVWILVIVLIAVEAARLFNVLPLDAKKGELASLGVAALVILFGLIYVIVRLSDGSLGFGFFLGIIGFGVLGYGGFMMFQAGDGMTTLKALQAKNAAAQAAPPAAPAPPAPPAAPPAPPAATQPPPPAPPAAPPAPPTTPPSV